VGKLKYYISIGFYMAAVDLLLSDGIELSHGGLYKASDLRRIVEVLGASSVWVAREDEIVEANGVIDIPDSMSTFEPVRNLESEERFSRTLLRISLERDVILSFRYGCRTGSNASSYVFDNNYSRNTGLEDEKEIHVYPENHSQR
tara:strand:+ start:1179 stop:1613 length:435 start_codon:yes stop_codon:yes gene_type:complete